MPSGMARLHTCRGRHCFRFSKTRPHRPSRLRLLCLVGDLACLGLGAGSTLEVSTLREDFFLLQSHRSALRSLRTAAVFGRVPIGRGDLPC
jgi:hypothetical protein